MTAEQMRNGERMQLLPLNICNLVGVLRLEHTRQEYHKTLKSTKH